MTPDMPEAEALAEAVRVLRAGGIVAYPTDTLYGLAADPRSAEAVARLFSVKGRHAGHAVPLIAADDAQAELGAEFSPLARRLARRFWPGPLSIVLTARPGIHDDVTAADGTVAVRVPAFEVARALARAFGFPVTATSANLSGQPPTASPADVRTRLGDRIDFLLDAGPAPGGAPSTIVDVREGAPRLVRAGAVPWERVLESVQ